MDVDDAFRAVNRQDFLPQDVQARANEDRALPIGYGQTNSQPYTVRKMLEWLEVEPGQKILDIGSGSGWTTALLSILVGERGYVHAVELVPELVDMGRNNCERVGIQNVTFHHAQKSFGYSAEAPYERILVSASASRLSEELIDQLALRGRMVVPIGETIYVISKDESSDTDIEEHPGFVFVPLIG